MPVLTLDFDALSGRPLLEVYVSLTRSEQEAVRGTDRPVPPALRLLALLDTGAGRSTLSTEIARELGLIPFSECDFYTASTGDAPLRTTEYVVDLSSAGNPPFEFARDLLVMSSDLSGIRVGLLLGRDVLSRCLLVYDGSRGRFTLAI
jgi:hypothetical protein